jgi:hypothetical protein
VALPDDKRVPEELEIILDKALAASKRTTDIHYRRREEKWNQLAFLAVEILGGRGEKSSASDNIPVAEKLINQVNARLRKQEHRMVEDLPSWGYRCLDHSQRINLIIAEYKLGDRNSRILEILRDAYFDCLYFLRSDHSFLRAWDANDPDWLMDQWSLECSSIVCSSFLSIPNLEWSTTPTDSESASQLLLQSYLTVG